MRTYELTLVLRPSLKEADRKKLLESVKDWLAPVKIVKENDWGQKALAYPIKKEDAGYYVMLELEVEDAEVSAKDKVSKPTGVPADFEQRLIRNDSVIRHLLMRTK
jgi:small subunit ribosomal protein S6